MRNLLLTTCLGAVAALAAGAAQANDELIKMSQNPKDWVMPTGNYANHRYSQLKQITADNVGKLQVAWTFSTGVLRGHEGGPLVIGDVMYVHGPFPNPVYALDLKNESQDHLEIRTQAGSERHPGDVLRYRQSRPRLCRRQDLPASGRYHARRARCQGRQGRLADEERRPVERRDRHVCPHGGQGQDPGRHLGRRVWRALSRDRLRSQERPSGLARLFAGSGRPDSWSIPRRPPNSASRSARIPASRPGKAISGRSVAAAPGAGSPTIPS